MLDNIDWENVKVDMAHPADYQFAFPNPEAKVVLYELWISPNKDKVELVIDAESRYIQLDKKGRQTFLKILTGEKLSDLNGTSANSTAKSENDKKLSINNDFKSISISKPKGFNEITFDDEKTLKAFQNIFSSAVREPGKVDMADPEFYMNVIYDRNNQQSLYLWIGEKGHRSTFMKTEDTSTIYTFSNDMTDKLIELVESRYN